MLYGHIGATITLTLILGLLIFTDCKIRLKDVFMLLGLIILTFMARRQFSLLLIIGVFSVSSLICDLIKKHNENSTEKIMNEVISLRGKIITIVIVVLASFGLFKDKFDDEYIDQKQYPVALSDYMIEAKENGILDFETMKIYNDYNYGSYLLYRGIPVFIDSRADLYSKEFNEGCNIFDDYMDISSIKTYFENKFEDYGITHIVTYRKSKIDMLISKESNYKKLYVDDNFIFYERLKK